MPDVDKAKEPVQVTRLTAEVALGWMEYCALRVTGYEVAPLRKAIKETKAALEEPQAYILMISGPRTLKQLVMGLIDQGFDFKVQSNKYELVVEGEAALEAVLNLYEARMPGIREHILEPIVAKARRREKGRPDGNVQGTPSKG